VTSGVADLPTAFVASYGASGPRIGIVALLDALPGLGENGAPAHGCGHNLIGAADLGAVLAVKDALTRHSLPGTIRFFGAPAEEIYHGGVYMVREGVFDDLDALLFWHPSSVTTVIGRSGLAVDSVRFVFRGRASDATDAADKGRNALTAAASLDERVRTARPGWPPSAVVNHVLLEGGALPSVVPHRATVWFFIHARNRDQVEAIRAEIAALAGKSAEATGTTVEMQILSSTRHWLINRTLAELLQESLDADEPLVYSEDEVALARKLREPFSREGDDPFFRGALPLSFGDEPVAISDDTADAGWVVPRGGFLVAAFPAGIPSHTLEWAASADSSFAHKGMMRAARTLVRAALRLLDDPARLDAARRELERALRGARYQSPLPEGTKPFDLLPRPH
jgi:aminobenzoyl-glutamate utilization protein B